MGGKIVILDRASFKSVINKISIVTTAASFPMTVVFLG